MTREDIVRMAKQAGMDYLQYLSPEAFEKVVVFSKLVAQHEREACANIVDENLRFENYLSELIRARGQV